MIKVIATDSVKFIMRKWIPIEKEPILLLHSDTFRPIKILKDKLQNKDAILRYI